MNPLKMLRALFHRAPRVAPLDGAARVRSGAAILIDVREPREWANGVAEHAVLLSLDDLTGARNRWRPFLAQAGRRELLLYCKSGGRSAIAARLLVSEGFRAANAGGLAEWTHAGWPVVHLAADASS